MALLGMRSSSTPFELPACANVTHLNTLKTIAMSRRLRTRRQQIVHCLGVLQIPFSSKLGQAFLKTTKDCLVTRPARAALDIERQLGVSNTPEKAIRCSNRREVISPLKNTQFRRDEYVHEYSFSKRQRIERNVELVLGVRQRFFSLLSTCKDVTVSMEKMTEEEIQPFIAKKPLRLSRIYIECMERKCEVRIMDLASSEAGRRYLARARVNHQKHTAPE